MQAADQLLKALARFNRKDPRGKALRADHNQSEARILYLLKIAGPNGMKVSELSRAQHVTSPFVTQQLNSMQERELIERMKDPADGRIVRIVLTEKGRKAAEEVDRNFRSMFVGLARHLGEEDTLLLAELLNKSFDYFDQRNLDREKECE